MGKMKGIRAQCFFDILDILAIVTIIGECCSVSLGFPKLIIIVKYVSLLVLSLLTEIVKQKHHNAGINAIPVKQRKK